VKTRFRLIKHINTEKLPDAGRSREKAIFLTNAYGRSNRECTQWSYFFNLCCFGVFF
jgi:hypothetical protein